MKCMFSTRNLQVRAKDRQVSASTDWGRVFMFGPLFSWRSSCLLPVAWSCLSSALTVSLKPLAGAKSLLCTHSITCQGLGFLLSPSQAILSKEFRWNLGGAVWETEIYSKNCRSYCAGFCCSLGCYSLSVTWVSVAPHLWHFMGSQLD